MSLNHDSQGFLTGAPVDLRRAVEVLREMRADLKAIRAALAGGGNPGRQKSERHGSAPNTGQPPAEPRRRGNGSSGRDSHQVTAGARTPISEPQRRGSQRHQAAAERGADGRFISGKGSGGNSPRGGPGTSADSTMLRRLAAAVGGAGDGMQEVDPGVKAMQEIAQPLARGYGMLADLKGKDRAAKAAENALPWYRRIYNVLQGIAEKNGPGGKTGGFSLSDLLPKMPDIPKLPGLSKIPGFLKKGSMAAAPLLAMYEAVKWIEDDSHDPERVKGIQENIANPVQESLKSLGIDKDAEFEAIRKKNREKLVDSEADTLLADRTSQIRAAIANSPTYQQQFAGLKPGSPEYDAKFVELSKDKDFYANYKARIAAYDQAAEQARIETERRKTVAGKIGVAWDETKAVVGQGAAAVGRGAAAVGRRAKAIGGKIGDRWNDAKQYFLPAADAAGVDPGMLAKTAYLESRFNADARPVDKDPSRNTVSGFDGRKALSSAHGYGQFLNKSWAAGVRKHGAKLGIVGAERMTDEQANAPELRNDKRLQALLLAESTKENIEKGKKYGSSDDDANAYAFHNLGDPTAIRFLTNMKADPNMSVREALLKGLGNAKARANVEEAIRKNPGLYGRGKENGNITAAAAYDRMGKEMRAGNEYAIDARNAMISSQIAPTAPVISSAKPPPKVSIPSPPAIADAPPQTIPMGSLEPKRAVVTPATPDAGQDVRNRSIAHIVTGGLSGKP